MPRSQAVVIVVEPSLLSAPASCTPRAIADGRLGLGMELIGKPRSQSEPVRKIRALLDKA